MADSQRIDFELYNIDNKDDFETCYSTLHDTLTTNFIVDFGPKEAVCGTNLDSIKFAALLEAPSQAERATRWINFWGGHGQRNAIKQVVSRYGLSPRLVHLLYPKHYAKTPQVPSSEVSASEESSAEDKNMRGMAATEDAEKGSNLSPAEIRANVPASTKQKATFGSIVDDLWHFCSIDWGENYVHIGLNQLFSLPGIEFDNGPNKPRGLRVWMSLILCTDGTVISVYQIPETAQQLQPTILKVVRRNVLNVFRQLSALHKGEDDSIMTVTVRNYSQVPPGTSNSIKSTEPAGLLLYYLLDDWITTFGLITRKDHPYRNELEQIRTRMFHTPDLLVIERLHSIGRQLQVLKLMYQSYELIVDRILQRQRTMKDEARWHIQNHLSLGGTYETLTMTENTPAGVRFSTSAIVRFERLLDRIRLLPLTEIEDCLNEKESLAVMSFNLISLKESHAIEKLTRITILLAKTTILFLSVSLMTGYFSVQIQDLQGVYSAKTYWFCFLVIVVLSVVGLFMFGIASDRLEGRIIYRSLTRTMVDRVLRRKRKVG